MCILTCLAVKSSGKDDGGQLKVDFLSRDCAEVLNGAERVNTVHWGHQNQALHISTSCAESLAHNMGARGVAKKELEREVDHHGGIVAYVKEMVENSMRVE